MPLRKRMHSTSSVALTSLLSHTKKELNILLYMLALYSMKQPIVMPYWSSTNAQSTPQTFGD